MPLWFFLLIKKIILTYLNEQPSINFKLPNSAIFKVHFLTLEVYILHIIWFLQNFVIASPNFVQLWFSFWKQGYVYKRTCNFRPNLYKNFLIIPIALTWNQYTSLHPYM